jgi:glycosyltransferase involved in cell wall biosynthesis
LHWPDDVGADFVVPFGDEFGLLPPVQAGEVLSIPFDAREGDGDGVRGADLRDVVSVRISELAPQRVKAGDLLAIYDSWLLPEVSYLPGVLSRFESMQRCLPTSMIGYDTLPMSEPANYRFRPGTAAWVSRYFRLLATTDSVVCISDYARDSILRRLRRNPALPISVAHPGGDHIDITPSAAPEAPSRPRFLRLGTLEARKRPQEILAAFRAAVARGLQAELVFVGEGSASAEAINADLRSAVAEDIGVSWVQGASDADVRDLVAGSDAFLSLGVEGYGIPVLEAIRLGTPVLFDGMQPAADLMLGKGARRIDAGGVDVDIERLAAALATYSQAGALAELQSEVDSNAVPTWRAFATSVATSTVD